MTKLYTYQSFYAFPTSIAMLHRAASAWQQASLLRSLSSGKSQDTVPDPVLQGDKLPRKGKASLGSLPPELITLVESELVRAHLELYDSDLSSSRRCSCPDIIGTPSFWSSYVVRQALQEFVYEELLQDASVEVQREAFERDEHYWPKAVEAFRRSWWWQCGECTKEEERFWGELKDLREDHPDEKIQDTAKQIRAMLREYGLTPVVSTHEVCTVGSAASPILVSLIEPTSLHTSPIELLPLPSIPVSELLNDPSFAAVAEQIKAVERFREAFELVCYVGEGKRAEGDEVSLRTMEVEEGAASPVS